MRVPLLLGAQPLVTPPTRISLGSGIPLDLAIGDGGVQGVAGGPVWTGGGYWTADGTGYWTGPTFDATDYEIVVRWTRPNTSAYYPFSVFGSSTKYAVMFQSGSATTWISGSNSVAGGAGTGNVAAFGYARGTRITLRLNASEVTAAKNGALLAGSVPFIGAYRYGAASLIPCQAGMRIWDVTVYERGLTPTERTNIYASGSQINPLTIAADAYACWDFANAYDSGGTPTVPDLVLSDGTRDLTGSPTVSIVDDITTGATF